jgi:hypothetical protein
LDAIRTNGAPGGRSCAVALGCCCRACRRVDFLIEALVAEAGDSADNPIAVAIETDRGLRVAAWVKPAACDV